MVAFLYKPIVVDRAAGVREASEVLITGLAITVVGVIVAVLITFAAWLSRVVENIPPLTGEYPRATPRLTILQVLVPGLNDHAGEAPSAGAELPPLVRDRLARRRGGVYRRGGDRVQGELIVTVRVGCAEALEGVMVPARLHAARPRHRSTGTPSSAPSAARPRSVSGTFRTWRERMYE